ncbi:MAG: tetratricopeptide repeat protein [Nitrospiraceae bacterium]|nr:tetratricopeptide repeat protein [Nitrospiraceae bacterium]
MATKAKQNRKKADVLDHPRDMGDWGKLIDQVKENPVLYGACAAFVVLCIVATVLYRMRGETGRREEMTEFARAVGSEEPGTRVAELEAISGGKSASGVRALYMLGEAAYEAKEYDKAKEAFERLRQEFPEAPSVPDAVEGLGSIAENADDYAGAIAAYTEILEKWPNSVAARRQQINIGRCYEELEQFGEAVAAYQAQLERVADSVFNAQAETALDRLRESHPDLFPEEEAEIELVEPGAEAPVETPAEAPAEASAEEAAEASAEEVVEEAPTAQ